MGATGGIPRKKSEVGRAVKNSSVEFTEKSALEEYRFLAIVREGEGNKYLSLIACLHEMPRNAAANLQQWNVLQPKYRDAARYDWAAPEKSDVDFQVGSLVKVHLRRRVVTDDAPVKTSLSSEYVSLLPVNNDEPADDRSNKESNWSLYEVEKETAAFAWEFLEHTSSPPPSEFKKLSHPGFNDATYAVLDEMRRHYFEKGVTKPPVVPTLLLSSDGHLAVGPVRWQPSDQDAGRYTACVTLPQSVPCYLRSSNAPISAQDKVSPEIGKIVGRTVRLLPPSFSLPTTLTERIELDFRPDAVLINEQIALWKEEDAALPFDKWFESHESRVNQDAPARGFRNYRLRKIIDAWNTEQTESNALRDLLIKTPRAEAILEAARRDAVAEIVETEREKIEGLLGTIREQLMAQEQKRAAQTERHQREAENETRILAALRHDCESLQISRDSLREEFATLQVEVAEETQSLKVLQESTRDLRAHATTQAEEAESLLTEAIHRLKDRPAQELAVLLPLRTALGLDNIVVRVELPAPLPIEPASVKRQPTALSPVFALSSANTHEDISGCRTSLRDSLGARGGDSWKSLAEPLLAAWLAGLLPVVAMEGSGVFWQTVARCLCACRYLPLYAPLAAQEPLDLLGYMDQGIFRPHAHRFADLLCESSAGGRRLFLIALQNIADCHWCSVLAPLLSARAEDRPLPLLHPSQIDENPAYQGLTSLVFPDALLLAASWDGLYPPAPAFWKHAILLIPDGGLEEITRSEQQVCELSLNEWQDARRAAQTSDDDEVRQAKDRIPAQVGVPLSPALRFFRALRSLGINAEKSNTLMRHHAILPPLVAQGHTKELGEAGKVKRLRMYLFGEIE